MTPTVSPDQLNRIVHAYHFDPFEVLGAHALQVAGQSLVAIRAFLPMAEQAWVVRDDAGRRRRSSGSSAPTSSRRSSPGRTDLFPYEIRTLGKGRRDPPVQGPV